jgi:predicted  nucleic acid-binding Zn-ribbon protein
MVDQPDKKDLIIQSVVNQRNNAMNVISDLESELHLLRQKIDALESEIQKPTEQI